MELKSLIQQVKKTEFIFLFFDTLFLALSGVGIIFVYNSSLFVSLDWVKLTILSAGITAPLVFFNIVIVSAIENIKPNEKDGLFFALTMSAVSTSILLNTALLVCYWFHFSFKNYSISIFIIEIILLLISFSKDLTKRKNG